MQEEEKQFIFEIAPLFQKSLNKERQCMYCSCSSKAINSHLLQKNGIINHIAIDNHVYELSKNFFIQNHINGIKFNKVGIKDAISLHLFCNTHDTKVFMPIESNKIDFDNYKNQILFAYRSVCADIRKKEILADFEELILQKDNLSKERRHSIKCRNKGTLLNIKDYTFYKEEMEKELKNPQGRFVFRHYTYPNLGVYASTAFSYIAYDNYEEKVLDLTPWECCFFNIIPTSCQTEILIGYHKERCNDYLLRLVNGLGDLNAGQLGVELTNILTFHVEDWGISPSLFERILPERIQHYLDVYSRYLNFHEASLRYEFNLFEDVFDF